MSIFLIEGLSHMPQIRFLLGKSDLAYLQDQLIHNATIFADILPNTLLVVEV